MESYVRVTGKGGITIPASFRRELAIKPGDTYRVVTIDGRLSLNRLVDKCIFCETDENHAELLTLNGKRICPKCARNIAKFTEKWGDVDGR